MFIDHSVKSVDAHGLRNQLAGEVEYTSKLYSLQPEHSERRLARRGGLAQSLLH